MIKKKSRTARHDHTRKLAQGSFELGQDVLLTRVESEAVVCSPFPVEAGDWIPAISVEDVLPGGQATWYYGGPPGTLVTFFLNRLQNTGGHNHPGGDVGSVIPPSAVLGPSYPQNQPAVFTAPISSGSIELVAVFAAGPVPSATGLNRVAVPGLIALTGGVGISLTGASATHPINHCGIPALIANIQQLAAAFYAKFGNNLFVNDMSLPDGGLYDFKNTWTPPHVTHREGRTVDINSTSMSPDESDFFRATALSLGFVVTLEATPPHWHLSI